MKHLLIPYGLEDSKVKKLDGYASINYHIETKTDQYVLKHYLDPLELDLIEGEEAILKSISSNLPFMLPASKKALHIQEDQSFTRLLDFIPGSFLSEVKQTGALLYNFGESIGYLNRALQGKRNPAIEGRKLFWDMQHCLLNRSKINYIQEASRRKLVTYFFDLFEHKILPVQPYLRYSIIHGDLNDNNVLVQDDKISGFIDFGDIAYSPLVNEIAIAMTYVMLANERDPFEKAIQVLKGYHTIIPLQQKEIELIYYLIPTRLSVSVCNSAEAQAKGGDTEYILISEKPAWRLLNHWISLNPVDVQGKFLDALAMSYTQADEYESLLYKRKKYTGKSVGLSYAEPIHMTGAAFQYMYSADGRTYLDAYNNIPHVGHCHPKVSQVISDKVRQLNTNTRYLYREFIEYSERLLEHFPNKLNKVFFVNSGSAATDLAIRMAKVFTQKNGLAVLEHGYHGNTLLGIEASSYKFDGKGGAGKPQGVLKLPLPNVYNGAHIQSDEYVEDALTQLQQVIDEGSSPAAFIAEPISGCGGQVPLAPGYLKNLRPFLERQQILTIIDEVQTGFGRLGNYFWGFEMHEIIPDIVILGKPMGNGHPMAAVVTTEDIAQAFANGMEFFSSFGGNPVSCAVGTTVLAILEEEKLPQNALKVGHYLKNELIKLKEQFTVLGDVRGQGLFLGIEFTTSTQQPDAKIAGWLKNQLKEKLILTGVDGPAENVIKIKPPLCFTRENATTLVDQLRDCLQQYQALVSPYAT